MAYFDQFEQTVAADRLKQPAYPKDPAAPICNCFGFTTAEIDADLREGATVRVKALLAKSQFARGALRDRCRRWPLLRRGGAALLHAGASRLWRVSRVVASDAGQRLR